MAKRTHHHDSQRLVDCPDCGQSIRLKPADSVVASGPVNCGCGTTFDVDRDTCTVTDASDN